MKYQIWILLICTFYSSYVASLCSTLMKVTTYPELIEAINCSANVIEIENNVTILGTVYVNSLSDVLFSGNGYYLTAGDLQTFQFTNCSNISIINLRFHSDIQNDALIRSINSSIITSQVIGDNNQAPIFWIESSSTLRLSRSNFTNLVSSLSGAIYCSNSQIRIDRTIFRNSRAPRGAAVDAYTCDLLITDSNFENNTAYESGGAISADFSILSIHYSSFSNNSATNGGALSFSNSIVNITSSKLYGNVCGDSSLPSSSFAGGAIFDINSLLTFNSVQFIANRAYGNGGAIFLASKGGSFENCDFLRNRAVDGGAAMLSTGSFFIKNSLISSNKATILTISGNGGGLFIFSHSSLSVERLQCQGNIATVSGGCVYLSSNYSLRCLDCQIIDNKAGSSVGSGGAISAIGRSPYRPILVLAGCNISSNLGATGGAIASSLTSLTIQNCNIDHNSGIAGGGLYLQSMYYVLFETILLNSNIATGQGGGVYATSSPLTIASSSVSLNVASGSQIGGGIYLGGMSTMYLKEVSMNGNSAGTASAIFATDTSTVFIDNSSIILNVARQSATIYVRSSSRLNVVNSVFNDNVGGATAGVTYCTSYSTCSFESSNFTSNLALTYGGAIVVDLWGEVTLQYCILSGNEGREAGGSFYTTTYGELTLESVTVHESSSVGKGGVAFLSTFGAVWIYNSMLHNNVAAIGGAIHAEFNANLYLDNVTLNDNVASYLGGVISALDTVVIIGYNLQFNNNHALYGGCLYLLIECDVTLTQINSHNNTAELQGGFVRAAGLVVLSVSDAVLRDHRGEYGGVADISSKGVDFFLADSVVDENQAEQYGGFVSIADGASLALIDCEVSNNDAVFGGGIYVSNGYATIQSSIFEKNSALDSGGAIKVYTGNISIEDSTFRSNSAEDSGGVFHCERYSALNIFSSLFSGNVALENGGVFYASDDTILTSVSNTFARNTALSFGGLLYSEKGGLFTFNTCSSTNNSASTGGGSLYLRTNFNLSVISSTFQGDTADDISYGGALHLHNPSRIFIKDSKFRHCKGGSGAALHIYGSSSTVALGGVSIFGSVFESNMFTTMMNSTARYATCMDQSSGNGGGVFLSNTVTGVRILDSMFSKNFGCNGGAIYAVGSEVLVENSSFTDNTAIIGGGAMFWKMPSPTPLITMISVSESNNKAKYGPLIATDKSTLSVTHETYLESSGHVFKSPVTVYVQDFYKQTVTSDLTSFVVINSRDASVVSGSTIIRASNGVAKFKEITITSTIGGKALMLFIISGSTPIGALRTFYFRNCTLGEIPQDAGIGLFNGNQVQLSQCYYCPPGSYALESTSTSCLDCPDNANCEGGNNINVKKGYWRVSNFSDDVLKCKGTSVAACKGGSNGPNTCSEGNKGPYCTLCKPQYIATIDGTCKYCSGKPTSSFGFIIAMVIIALIFLFILCGWFYRRKIITCFESTYNSIVDTLESQSSKLKILFAFTQIMSQFPAVLAMPRIPFYSTLNSYLGVLSFNLLSYFQVQCEFNYTFYDKLLLVTVVPIFIAPIIYIYYYIKAFLSTLKNSTNPDFSYWDAKRQATYYFLVLLFVTFAPSSTTVLQAFVCENFDDGSSYMYADYSLSCETDEHRKYVIYAAVMVFVYPLGIPLFYLYLLWSNLRAINPPTKRVVKDAERDIVSPEIIQLEKLNLRDNDDTITHLSFLYESYRPGAWYFEVIECLRRLFLTAVPSLILPGTAVQTIIVLIFSMVFSFLYAELKPFVVHSDSIAAIAAEWGLTLTLIMGLIVTVSDYEDSLASAAKNFIGLVMISLNIGTMIFTVYVSVFNHDDKQKKALDKFNTSRNRKRVSSSARLRKRGTNETLLAKVRLSFKNSLRRSGLLDPSIMEEVQNPANVELTEVKEKGIRRRDSRLSRSRMKSRAHDSDDESDSDDNSENPDIRRRQVILSHPQDSLQL